MKKLKQKTLSWLLSLTLICGMMPMMSLTAFAAASPVTDLEFRLDATGSIALYYTPPSTNQHYAVGFENTSGVRVMESGVYTASQAGTSSFFSVIEHLLMVSAVSHNKPYTSGEYKVYIYTWDSGEFSIPNNAVKSTEGLTLNLTVNPAIDVTAAYTGMDKNDLYGVGTGPCYTIEYSGNFNTNRVYIDAYSPSPYFTGAVIGQVSESTVTKQIAYIPSAPNINESPDNLAHLLQYRFWLVEASGRSVSGIAGKTAGLTITSIQSTPLTLTDASGGSTTPTRPESGYGEFEYGNYRYEGYWQNSRPNGAGTVIITVPTEGNPMAVKAIRNTITGTMVNGLFHGEITYFQEYDNGSPQTWIFDVVNGLAVSDKATNSFGDFDTGRDTGFLHGMLPWTLGYEPGGSGNNNNNNRPGSGAGGGRGTSTVPSATTDSSESDAGTATDTGSAPWVSDSGYSPMRPISAPGEEIGATKTNNPLVIDGEEADFPAVNIHGYNWLKLRDFAALLSGTGKQFSISFNAATNTISITTGGAYTPLGDELTDMLTDDISAISSLQSILIDGKPAEIAAYNIGGYNYFRLRDLAIMLDIGVLFDDDTGVVELLLDEGYTE